MDEEILDKMMKSMLNQQNMSKEEINHLRQEERKILKRFAEEKNINYEADPFFVKHLYYKEVLGIDNYVDYHFELAKIKTEMEKAKKIDLKK